jgi:hypothetical protein
MKRGHAVWGWFTSVLGAVLVLLMAGQVIAESMWLGKQGHTTGNYSYMPLYLVGLVGVILIVGGAIAAISARRSSA